MNGKIFKIREVKLNTTGVSGHLCCCMHCSFLSVQLCMLAQVITSLGLIFLICKIIRVNERTIFGFDDFLVLRFYKSRLPKNKIGALVLHATANMYMGPQSVFALCLCCCSVAGLCLTHCGPMDCSARGSFVLHYLSAFSPPDTSTTQHRFCFGPSDSFFLELSVTALCSSPVAYWTPLTWGTQLPMSYVLSLHTIHGVLQVRILEWIAIHSSRGPHFVRTLHCDLSVLGGPARHGS